jgi:hypothetical protein
LLFGAVPMLRRRRFGCSPTADPTAALAIAEYD